jgi:hypothetical protein
VECLAFWVNLVSILNSLVQILNFMLDIVLFRYKDHILYTQCQHQNTSKNLPSLSVGHFPSSLSPGIHSIIISSRKSQYEHPHNSRRRLPYIRPTSSITFPQMRLATLSQRRGQHWFIHPTSNTYHPSSQFQTMQGRIRLRAIILCHNYNSGSDHENFGWNEDE